MPHHDDEPMYRTFEEFEREELRRADAVGSVVDEMFDHMFTEELTFATPKSRRPARQTEDADDEE